MKNWILISKLNPERLQRECRNSWWRKHRGTKQGFVCLFLMLAGKHVCKSLNFLLDCCRIKNTCSKKNTQSVSGGNYEGQKTQILQKPKNRWIEIIEKNQTWLWMIKFSQHNLLKWEESKNTTCCKHSQSIINIPKVKSVVHFYFTTGFIKHFKKKFWKDMKTLSENREKTATKQTTKRDPGVSIVVAWVVTTWVSNSSYPSVYAF